MTSASKSRRSKKRSASNRARPRSTPTLYIDENLGRRVARGLAAAGIRVVSAIDLHPGVEDHIWVPAVAAKGYVVLTKDQRLRRNVLEVSALLYGGARTFVLTADLSPDETVALITKRWTKILRICQRRDPFLFTITASGIITEVSQGALRRRAKASAPPEAE